MFSTAFIEETKRISVGQIDVVDCLCNFVDKSLRASCQLTEFIITNAVFNTATIVPINQHGKIIWIYTETSRTTKGTRDIVVTFVDGAMNYSLYNEWGRTVPFKMEETLKFVYKNTGLTIPKIEESNAAIVFVVLNIATRDGIEDYAQEITSLLDRWKSEENKASRDVFERVMMRLQSPAMPATHTEPIMEWITLKPYKEMRTLPFINQLLTDDVVTVVHTDPSVDIHARQLEARHVKPASGITVHKEIASILLLVDATVDMYIVHVKPNIIGIVLSWYVLSQQCAYVYLQSSTGFATDKWLQVLLACMGHPCTVDINENEDGLIITVEATKREINVTIADLQAAIMLHSRFMQAILPKINQEKLIFNTPTLQGKEKRQFNAITFQMTDTMLSTNLADHPTFRSLKTCPLRDTCGLFLASLLTHILNTKSTAVIDIMRALGTNIPYLKERRVKIPGILFRVFKRVLSDDILAQMNKDVEKYPYKNDYCSLWTDFTIGPLNADAAALVASYIYKNTNIIYSRQGAPQNYVNAMQIIITHIHKHFNTSLQHLNLAQNVTKDTNTQYMLSASTSRDPQMIPFNYQKMQQMATTLCGYAGMLNLEDKIEYIFDIV